MHLDPRRHAVRGDLADIRLADRVFAPHYAAPMQRILLTSATLHAAASAHSEPMASLAAGSVFEVLDLLDAFAWGVAPVVGLVGYVACDQLDLRT